MAKEYFSHDYNARHDRKIAALVMDYKSSGYGIFWATSEIMHEEGDRLEFDDLTLGSIAKDLNEEVAYVKEVLDKCVLKYKLFQKDDILLTSNRVKKNLAEKKVRMADKSEIGRLGGIASGESRRSKQNEAPVEPNKQTLEPNEPLPVTTSKELPVKKITTSKEKEHADLLKSNLYRQPNVPHFEEVFRVFLQNGGTKEMAQKFFDKNTSLEWFLNGSPIKNFANLVPGYISTWQENRKNQNSKNGQSNSKEVGKSIEFDRP